MFLDAAVIMLTLHPNLLLMYSFPLQNICGHQEDFRIMSGAFTEKNFYRIVGVWQDPPAVPTKMGS